MNPIPAFAQSYAEARRKFLAAAAARALTVQTHEHPGVRGAQGEILAMEAVAFGEAGSSSLLVLTSAMHGEEGFAGSGVQVALLDDDDFFAMAARSGAAILFVHGVNPYGFSHVRRCNEDNVDLNRNFRDFSKAVPPNGGYAEIHDFVVPSDWPPKPASEARIGEYIARHGARALQQAVSAGQYERADGLFYGGARPAWSNRTLRSILREHGASRTRLLWIDLHTGLGPYGHGEKIFAGPNDPAMIERARTVWGADVTSFYDGSSTSAELTGLAYNAALDECPAAELASIGLEFGTLPFAVVFQALRGEQWLHNHPDAPESARDAIRRASRDAAYCDADDWKAMVYGQSRAACIQALRALGFAGATIAMAT